MCTPYQGGRGGWGEGERDGEEEGVQGIGEREKGKGERGRGKRGERPYETSSKNGDYDSPFPTSNSPSLSLYLGSIKP